MIPVWIREVAKAFAAGLSTFAATLAAGTASDGLAGAETLVAVVGAVGAGLLTFAVPNAAPSGTRRTAAE